MVVTARTPILQLNMYLYVILDGVVDILKRLGAGRPSNHVPITDSVPLSAGAHPCSSSVYTGVKAAGVLSWPLPPTPPQVAPTLRMSRSILWLSHMTSWPVEGLYFTVYTVHVADLGRVSAAACLLGLWVRIPLKALLSVSCESCVLSLLITRPEESYRMWCLRMISTPQQWGGRGPLEAFEPWIYIYIYRTCTPLSSITPLSHMAWRRILFLRLYIVRGWVKWKP